MIGSCVGERMMRPLLVPYAATEGATKMFTRYGQVEYRRNGGVRSRP